MAKTVKNTKNTAEKAATAAPAWTWEICDGRPDEAVLVPAPGPLEAMQLYLQRHAAPERAHTYTVRPAACAGGPFPAITVEVCRDNGGAPTVQMWADPVAWAEAVAAAASKKLLVEQRSYLQGPIIVGSSSWTNTPEWLRRAIPKARLRQVILELTGLQEARGLATLEEVVAYLMAASLEAPLAEDAVEVYFWAAAQVLVEYGMVENIEALGNKLGGSISGELTEYQRSEFLQPLQRFIRQSVVKHTPRGDRPPMPRRKNCDRPEQP